LLIQRGEARLMIDCGGDWLGRLHTIAPTAIVLTHAHPDHAYGLADGAPCPVYATKETLDLIRHFPISARRRIRLGRSTTIGGVTVKAFPVHHSLRAPAVGYRLSAEASCFFYLPDVADLPKPAAALRGVDPYIGDGATITRTMVRKKDGNPIGHASIAAQLAWCANAGVRRAIFTHCGSGIVRGDARQVEAKVRRLGRAHGVEARLARDGGRLLLP
jgi:phosphoribosyl 1,2-cyclic phosphodiesterase